MHFYAISCAHGIMQAAFAMCIRVHVTHDLLCVVGLCHTFTKCGCAPFRWWQHTHTWIYVERKRDADQQHTVSILPSSSMTHVWQVCRLACVVCVLLRRSTPIFNIRNSVCLQANWDYRPEVISIWSPQQMMIRYVHNHTLYTKGFNAVKHKRTPLSADAI